jgi:flagellar biosynthesis/type III secretory pathway chaperone
MTELILALVETMEKETAHFRRLIELGEAQKEILVTGKMEPLAANIRLQEKEVFALGPLSAGRMELLGKIGALAGRKKLDLKQVPQVVPAVNAAPLKEAVVRLMETVKKLDELNRSNGKLLNNAVSFASFTLRLIQGSGKKAAFSPGRAPEAEKNSFVNRVV